MGFDPNIPPDVTEPPAPNGTKAEAKEAVEEVIDESKLNIKFVDQT